jgi:hypothetical protein
MGKLYPFDPNSGPAVPDLPPISIGALAVGLTDLLGRAGGLVLPRHVIITESAQEFALQFAPVTDSARVITSWATRFGGVVDAHTCEPAPGQPHRHITLTFDYYGVTVEAYTFIPVTRQEKHS